MNPSISTLTSFYLFHDIQMISIRTSMSPCATLSSQRLPLTIHVNKNQKTKSAIYICARNKSPVSTLSFIMLLLHSRVHSRTLLLQHGQGLFSSLWEPPPMTSSTSGPMSRGRFNIRSSQYSMWTHSDPYMERKQDLPRIRT